MSDVEDLFDDDDQQVLQSNPISDPIEDDGLFGDDDEEDIVKPKKRPKATDELEDGIEDSDSQESEEEESRPIHIREDVIARLPPSQKNSDSFYARIPAFITLEPRPFDSNKFLEQAKQNEKEQENNVRLADENMVLWKYAKKDDTMVKQSNARFVKWSDGSLSLQLGHEIFDVEQQSLYDPSFLCLSHTSNSLLQTTKLLTKSAKFVPTSTSSKTHIKLAQALTKKQLQNVTVVSGHATVEDPEKVQREAEKQQMLTLKARRKLESKRQQQQDDYGYSSVPKKKVTGSRYQLDEDEEEEYGRPLSNGNDYEEDDFVVDDENEDAMDEDDDDDLMGADNSDGDSDGNADRLRQVKQKGQEAYRDHKKRRVIDDDDED